MKKIIVFLSIAITACMSSCSYIEKEETRDICYSGIITNKFFDDKNHRSATFTVRVNNTIVFEGAQLYPDSWEYANIGDSIIKEKGELYLTIKKKNGDATMFPYWE